MDGGSPKEHILIVDDEPQILLALEDQLSDSFNVHSCASAEAALKTMEDIPNIAVVVTDQRMPRMTGDELLSRIPGGAAVGIMVSGFADLPAVIRAINEGRVFAYVTKPWRRDDLTFKVSKAVEHFRLARQIAHERRLLADLMNNSPDGIVFKDRQLRIERANRSFAQTLGVVSPDELIGRKLSDGLLQSELAARIETEEHELISQGRPLLDVVREHRGPGASQWYSESKAPIRSPELEIDGLVAISRNVTDRVQTQAALQQSETRLRQQTRILNSILEGIGEGVVVVDREGRTLLFNSETQRLLGPQARDVALSAWPKTYGIYLADGRTPVPPEENPLLLAISGMAKVETSVIVKSNGAPEARVVIVATPLRNDSGQTSGAIALLRDVTQKYNLEQLLMQSQKMEAIGQLAGGVAHDFNNLLAVIEGHGEMAVQALEGHDAREDVLDMVAAAKRAASLTRQLLAFSRRDAARPQPLQLADVVASVEKLLKRLIGERVTLLTRLSAVGLVMADSNQLEQALLNLCVNARDAMPEGGTVSIELSAIDANDAEALQGGPSVKLCVSDTGSGMPPDVMKRIFEPFFTTKEVGKGTGLGLSMVYGIVNQNGGQISVESEVGRGTRFTLRFPVTDQNSIRRPSQRAPGMARGNGTVLLVEDEPSVRNITARILRRNGYVVLEASRPSEARSICDLDANIDLLVTDVALPEMSGVALGDELTLRYPRLRVLYMTGHASAAFVRSQTSKLTPEDRVLQKPFSSDALLQAVRATLLEPS